MRVRELLIAMLLGCSGGAPSSGPATTPAEPTTMGIPEQGPTSMTPGQAVVSCKTDADCATGEACEGKGCGDDTPGVCRSSHRSCTRDLRAFCGCDGQTFRASGSCPGHRYSSEGECPGSAP